MKKTLIGLFLVLGATSFANYGKVEVKGGLDLGGKYRYGKNYRDQKTKNTSGEVGVEYRYEVLPGLELGTGTAFQFHKDLKDKGPDRQNYKNYNSIPVYGTAKYTFDTPTAIRPYIKGDLGYSVNNGNHDFGIDGKFKAKNGLYYGAGIGANYNNVNLELMYKENKGRYQHNNLKYDANYRRVSLGVGYDFNLSQ